MNKDLNIDVEQFWLKNNSYWCSFKASNGDFKVIKCLKNEYGINFMPYGEDLSNPDKSWFNDAFLIKFVPIVKITKFDFMKQTHNNKIKSLQNKNIMFENLSEKGKKFVINFEKWIKSKLADDLSNFYPATGYKNPISFLVIDNNFCFHFTNNDIKNLMSFEDIPLEEINDIHDFLKKKNYFISQKNKNEDLNV